MNRGSESAESEIEFLWGASMRPRFMNRGSHVWTCAFPERDSLQ